MERLQVALGGGGTPVEPPHSQLVLVKKYN